MRQCAVIGQYQCSFRIVVQPPYRKEPTRDVASQVGHGGSALRICPGGDHACGLVEHEVAGLGGRGDNATVEGDAILRLDARAKLGHRPTIHGNPAFRDELLRAPPRRHA